MSNLPGYILLANEDMDEQYFIKIAVNEINPILNIKTVDDGAQALIFLNKMKKRDPLNGLPIFIITDLNMSRVNGYEFLKKVKSVKHLKDIPVFVLTTSAPESTLARAVQYGALKCYTKPIELTELKPIIAEMISIVFNNNTV
ncbi:MAG: response regulator [Bacteroidia bacterium]